MKIDNEVIISYLSDELNKEDKTAFELELVKNSDLKLILEDLNANDSILQNMPQYKTSTDFMVGLNNKIEAYEQSNIPWYTKMFDQIINLDTIPKLAVTSVLFVLSFTLFKINSASYKNLSNSTIDDSKDLIAIAEDSLYQQSDSLSHDPTLLISKDK